MKSVLKYLALGLVVMALLVGCGKQPTQEINDAKAAIDAVVADGAEKYAPEDVKVLNDALTSAMDEIKVQDGKFFKNYGKAKEALVKVKADAETLKTAIPQKKEEAKTNALVAQEAAKTAVAEAASLMKKAPKGKGTKADIAALQADLKGLQDSLAEVQGLIDTEDYRAAGDKATAIKDKAAGISEQVNQALGKAGAK